MSVRPPAVIWILATIALTVMPFAASGTNSMTFEVRLVPGTLKVLPDSIPQGTPGAPLRITAVRNEYVPFQVAVSGLSGSSDFSVVVTRLAGAKGAIEVPPSSMLLVENVLVKNPSIPNAAGTPKNGGRLWPDPLPPLRSLRVCEGETRAVWVDLFVPPLAAPGLYKGAVIVSSTHGDRVELPIEVDVRDVTLPVAPTLRTAFGNGSLSACLEGAHHVVKDSPEYQRLIEEYYWFLVEHRLSPYYIPVSIYSDEAHRFLDDPRVTFFVIPAGGGSGKGSAIWNDEDMNRLSDRLEKTGWIDKGAFYVIDEPKEDAFSDVVKVGKRIHSVNPRFRYLMTPDSGKILSRQDVLDEASIDIWAPMLTVMSKPNERAILLKEQEKGKELWWYTCVVPKWKGMNYFIDEAATAPRLHPWMNFLYGNTGILYWATENWRRVGCDPWSETETYPTANGDGSLVYPGRDSMSPVASIRLKMLREGLEDYELLKVLGGRLRKAADTIGGLALGYRPDERLFEHALALITEEGRSRVSGEGTPYLMHVTRDYREIEKRRKLVLDEVEQALEPPLLLLTTSPNDNDFTRSRAATVRGFVEDGTRVELNDVVVPVRENAFIATVPLTVGRNVIRVRGTNDKGQTKTALAVIVRE